MLVTGIFQKTFEGGAVYTATPFAYSPFSGKKNEFRAKGENLPCLPEVKYRFDGRWDKTEDGEIFVVTSACEEEPKTYSEMVHYLSTLDGWTKEDAEKLVDWYGYKELTRRLSEDPFSLTMCENRWVRLSRFKVKKLWTGWLKRKDAKALFDYLSPFGISDKDILQVYQTWYIWSMNVLRDPYRLMEIPGITFQQADKIALARDIERDSLPRLSAGIIEALRQAEEGGPELNKINRRQVKIQSGSTCLRWDDLVSMVRLITGDDIQQDKIGNACIRMEGRLVNIKDDQYFFRKDTYAAEKAVADHIIRLMTHGSIRKNLSEDEMKALLPELRTKGGLQGDLAPGQQNAVRTALREQVSVITGGPGTGKTTIQRAILYLLNKYIPEAKICLMAPTGRAASRMAQSAGRPAATIHSALGIQSSTDQTNGKLLDADVVIIDEFSMVDSMLAEKLFGAVRNGSKVICIGDENQLPSVGAGAVLREMIASNVVPVAVLTDVFRQKNGSSINDNAYAILNGSTEMKTDSSFVFEEASQEEAADKIDAIYKESIEEFGLENVVVLTPFRRKTDTGVNELNPRLRRTAFPEMDPKRRFQPGDRVMFTKNMSGIANGDVGSILRMEGPYVIVDFEGKTFRLSEEDAENLVLAYSTTVHKSQGSEYACVILAVDPRHSIMLQKQIVYTAVTRAKKKCICVGSTDAFEKAILQAPPPRLSLLGKMLKGE